MKDQYWPDFWKEYGRESRGQNTQTRVLRTLNKQPIDPRRWQRTMRFIEDTLEPKDGDRALDLACGNGLITRMLAERCKSVTAVDVSPDLLAEIDPAEHPTIETLEMDMRDCAFPDASFDKIVLYAGLQYLDDREALNLWKKAHVWLRPGGAFFLGDIPDRDLLWTFFDSEEREDVYFDRLETGQPLVGNWYTRDFLTRLARYAGFTEAKILPQADYMIYSTFRFDLLARKG